MTDPLTLTLTREQALDWLECRWKNCDHSAVWLLKDICKCDADPYCDEHLARVRKTRNRPAPELERYECIGCKFARWMKPGVLVWDQTVRWVEPL